MLENLFKTVKLHKSLPWSVVELLVTMSNSRRDRIQAVDAPADTAGRTLGRITTQVSTRTSSQTQSRKQSC